MNLKSQKITRLLIHTCLIFGSLSALQAQRINRADYSITVPTGGSVDAAEPDIDLDHLTTINFADGNTLGIVVLDRMAGVDLMENYKARVTEMKNMVKSDVEEASNFLTAIGGNGVKTTGKVNGMEVTVHIGYLKGKKKDFLFFTYYLKGEEGTALANLLKTIATFKEGH